MRSKPQGLDPHMELQDKTDGLPDDYQNKSRKTFLLHSIMSFSLSFISVFFLVNVNFLRSLKSIQIK